jgi:hypothetical protein
MQKNLIKTENLEKLQKKELRTIAKGNNIKVTLKMTKSEIIKSILKTQDAVFRNLVAHEFQFPDDVIEPTKKTANPHTLLLKQNRVFTKNTALP